MQSSPFQIFTIKEAGQAKITSPFLTTYSDLTWVDAQSELSVIPLVKSFIFKTGSFSKLFFGGNFWHANPFRKSAIELSGLVSHSAPASNPSWTGFSRLIDWHYFTGPLQSCPSCNPCKSCSDIICLNNVSAIASKVAFWRCNRSILSSKLLRTD